MSSKEYFKLTRDIPVVSVNYEHQALRQKKGGCMLFHSVVTDTTRMTYRDYKTG